MVTLREGTHGSAEQRVHTYISTRRTGRVSRDDHVVANATEQPWECNPG